MAYHPRFHITPHLLHIIEAIAAYRQQIAASTIHVPWVPVLQRESRARTTHASTAIEGNPLTIEEVRAIEAGRVEPGIGTRAQREVVNQLAGLRFIEKHQGKKRITRTDLLRLHTIIAAEVMDQGTAGAYRNFGVRVGAYVPPPATMVPRLMRDFLEWWNGHAGAWSPVISSAILHYRLEEIHPFGDGNGRMGRTLALWELYRRGFDTQHIFAIDEIYWEQRARYYAQLDAVRQAKGDLTGWLEYAAEALHMTLERVLARIAHLTATASTTPATLTPKQERLLHRLRDADGLTPQQIWTLLGVTKQGAAKILKPLLAAQLIHRTGTRKSGRYRFGSGT